MISVTAIVGLICSFYSFYSWNRVVEIEEKRSVEMVRRARYEAQQQDRLSAEFLANTPLPCSISACKHAVISLGFASGCFILIMMVALTS